TSRGSFSTPARALFRFQSVCFGKSETRFALASTILSWRRNRCEDAIISATIDGVVMTWNNRAERIFGYTASEMVGPPLARLSRGDGETDQNKHPARL